MSILAHNWRVINTNIALVSVLQSINRLGPLPPLALEDFAGVSPYLSLMTTGSDCSLYSSIDRGFVQGVGIAFSTMHADMEYSR